MGEKHSAYDLVQMQSLPLEAKITMTQQRIREWYDYWNGKVHVSFSGGKDSTVLKHIVDNMYSDIPSVFVNTGLEFIEIQQFAKNQPNTVVVRPEMRFDEVLKTFGYPVIGKQQARYIRDLRNAHGQNDATVNLRLTGMNKHGEYCPSMKLAEKWIHLKDAPFDISEQCCDVMKKNPLKKYQKETGRKPIVATMACESSQRQRTWRMTGCNAFDAKSPKSAPMSFWTENDILKYLTLFDVPYCTVYGEIKCKDDGTYYTTGEKRTGCIFCAFGCHLEEEPNRFQRLKESHPRQYEYCIEGGMMVDGKLQPSKEGLGLGMVLDYIGIKH